VPRLYAALGEQAGDQVRAVVGDLLGIDAEPDRPVPRGRAGATTPERPESAPALDARALLDRTSSVSLRNTMPRRTGTIRRAPT
jgi:hypothetical protein